MSIHKPLHSPLNRILIRAKKLSKPFSISRVYFRRFTMWKATHLNPNWDLELLANACSSFQEGCRQSVLLGGVSSTVDTFLQTYSHFQTLDVYKCKSAYVFLVDMGTDTLRPNHKVLMSRAIPIVYHNLRPQVLMSILILLILFLLPVLMPVLLPILMPVLMAVLMPILMSVPLPNPLITSSSSPSRSG